MPACWYVLMRYWLRVDDVVVRCVRGALACPGRAAQLNALHRRCRLREPRVFCKTTPTGGATVLRERSIREETFEGLRARCVHARPACCAVVTALTPPGRSGAPATLAQYRDGESASQVLLAAGGPVTVTYERLDIPAA